MSETMARTPENNADEASNAIEGRLRLIIDTIPTMVWTLQPDGAVDFVNQRWMDYTGLSLDEEMEDPTRPVHPEDLPRVMKKWLVDLPPGNPPRMKYACAGRWRVSLVPRSHGASARRAGKRR